MVLAPVVLAQVALGVGRPVMLKLITPLGARAPLDPVTVAVKSSWPPKVGLARVVIATTGVARATTVAVEVEVAPTAL